MLHSWIGAKSLVISERTFFNNITVASLISPELLYLLYNCEVGFESEYVVINIH